MVALSVGRQFAGPEIHKANRAREANFHFFDYNSSLCSGETFLYHFLKYKSELSCWNWALIFHLSNR